MAEAVVLLGAAMISYAESTLRIALAFGFCCAACTPVSRPGGNFQASDDGGPDASVDGATDGGGHEGPDRDADADADASMTMTGDAAERCDHDGELRCTRAARQRERCEGERWTATDACSESEVCAAMGQCSAVNEVCRGNAAAAVCDGGGTMFKCGSNGVAASSEKCASARHCQLGIAAGSCAICLPGEFHCNGDSLEVCDAAGRTYQKTEACPAGACDAVAGMCRGAACPEQRAICEGDVLKVCPRGATSFNEVARCDPTLCNAAAARCDACLPGTRSCEGDTAVSCATDGSQRERRDCAQDQVHCVGAGQCVECGRDADCEGSSPCKSAYCDLVSGMCAEQPRPVGSPCPDGMCSPDGTCVACLAETDCPAAGACQSRSCDAATHICQLKPASEGTRCGSGSGVCDAVGMCVGCVADSGCPAVGVCQVQHCEAATKTCEPQPAPDGQDCTGSFGAGSCRNGRCVQCREDADCGAAGLCEQAFCRTSDSSCQRRPSSAGAACTGGKVCDGAAHCVECAADLHCGENATCLSNACTCKTGFVKNPTGKGCNFDDCAKIDDNRCAVTDGTANTCKNTVDGYDCTCAAPWKLGSDQCYQGGSASDTRTVNNGSSWNVFPDFGVTCANAFDQNNPCMPPGQLTWLNVCGLMDTDPSNCSTIAATGMSLGTVTLKRVTYTGPLQDYGQPNGQGGTEVLLPAVGDVILVQTLSAVYLMRITALDSGSMTYQWAAVLRDACWRPGGLTCTAACSCPGGN
jgi:hypothetical protein